VFEGLGVLDDVPGEVGIVLWQALRDVNLWAGAPREERAVLFTAGAGANRMAAVLAAGAPAALEGPLGVMARVAGDPAGAREETVSLACREVALWLEERGLPASALTFAQAAAGAAPGDPAAAYAVGRLARHHGEGSRAESWLRRTVTLARHAGDWHHYARAFLSLGALFHQRGNLPAAERALLRCLGSARRHALRDLEAYALHDLFTLAVDRDDAARAEEHAQEALRAYGARHARLPILAHDVAWFWTTRSAFAPALAVLRSVLPHVRNPSERAVVHSVMARAAGGAGDAATFQSAWDDTQAILEAGVSAQFEAAVHLELAHGAASLGEWDRAEAAATQAFDLAVQRNEGKVRLTAEAVLEAAQRRRGTTGAPAPEARPALSARSGALAARFVESLALAGAHGAA
jgi:tetratricopeptide (TPR) repeat protein